MRNLVIAEDEARGILQGRVRCLARVAHVTAFSGNPFVRDSTVRIRQGRLQWYNTRHKRREGVYITEATAGQRHLLREPWRITKNECVNTGTVEITYTATPEQTWRHTVREVPSNVCAYYNTVFGEGQEGVHMPSWAVRTVVTVSKIEIRRVQRLRKQDLEVLAGEPGSRDHYHRLHEWWGANQYNRNKSWHAWINNAWVWLIHLDDVTIRPALRTYSDSYV